MNKFFKLTWVFLKNFGQSSGKKSKLPKTLIFSIIMLACLAPLAISIGVGVGHLYDILASLKQQGVILAAGFSAVALIVFIFGILMVINTFYFSKDVEYLLPLPLRPSQIIGAKFAVVLFYEYLTELIILLPLLISYGYKSSAGVIYYIYGLIVFLTLPIIPIVLDSFLAIIIMRFTNIGKHKERFKTIGALFGLGIGVGIQFLNQSFTGKNMSQDKIIDMFQQGNNSFVGVVTKLFPFSDFAVKAMINPEKVMGLVYVLLFLAVTAAFIGVFAVLGEGLYFKGVIGISEAPSRRKKLSAEEFDKTIEVSSSIKSYLTKEFKIMFRTSAYLINCVVMNFIWPLFFIPVLFNPEGFGDLKKYTVNIDNQAGGLILPIAFGVMMFIIMSNSGAASTAISREGQNLFVCKYIPMSYRKQIMAKALSGIILTSISVVMFVVIAAVMFKLPVILLILMAVLGFLGVIATSFIGIFIDLNFPKLQWENEQKAVKQNMNLMLNMLITAAVAALIIFIVIKLGLGMWAAFGMIAALYGVLSLAIYFTISTSGAKIFSNIE